MAVTEADVETLFNTYVGDSSTDRITAAQRLQYVTEATEWLIEETSNDHTINTYVLPYLDTVYYYEVSSALADILDGADLRYKIGNNQIPFSKKSAKEMSVDVGGDEPAYAIEWKDNIVSVVVNSPFSPTAFVIDNFASVSNWTADITTSDALNITLDEYEANNGSSSLNFDVDVSQSANNRATIYNETDSNDLSMWEDTGVVLLDVYFPDVTEISSVTIKFGSSSTDVWTITVTSDIDGNSFANGWNTLAFEWSAATATGTPDSTAVDYFRIDINYTASQVDDTGFRVDFLRIAKPDNLTFFYQSWFVGTDTTGATSKRAFTATTDVPYFSGQYDQYKYAVAHKAASIAFYNLRLKEEAILEAELARDELKRKKKLFPTVKSPEVRNFKVRGLNFNK